MAEALAAQTTFNRVATLALTSNKKTNTIAQALAALRKELAAKNAEDKHRLTDAGRDIQAGRSSSRPRDQLSTDQQANHAIMAAEVCAAQDKTATANETASETAAAARVANRGVRDDALRAAVVAGQRHGIDLVPRSKKPDWFLPPVALAVRALRRDTATRAGAPRTEAGIPPAPVTCGACCCPPGRGWHDPCC